jgi:hypothetical protein
VENWLFNLKSINTLEMSMYADEIVNIDNEMKRLRKHLKELKELKKAPTEALYRYMKSRDLKVYKSIKIEKVTPPLPRLQKKTPSQKKYDALKFFRDSGVGDPEGFYQHYLLTQKPELSE